MMKTNPIIENHHGINVWTNSITDNIRREECLCLNCKDIYNCPIAKTLYSICCDEDIAFIMTRCKNLIIETLKFQRPNYNKTETLRGNYEN